MASKMKVVFQMNASQGTNRVKLAAMHPLRKWVGIINQNNTFSLWNYEQKILIKSFSCNTLDDTPLMKGPIQVKQILFFDKNCITESLGNDKNEFEGVFSGHGNMRNNIVFVTNSKLIFYDYVTDMIKPISEKDFEQKTIRRVCVYSRDKICIAMGDGSFKVLNLRDHSLKNEMSIRNIRGFHTKPITWIFSYSQNTNEMPKVITASGQDAQMACWNIDMILKTPESNQGLCAPCFKFTSSKSLGQNNNEQIRSLQYDPASFRLVTVSEHHVRIWSTMTGMEVKRIKNSFTQKEMIFFNHFSYIHETFLSHAGGTRIMVTHNANGVTEKIDEIETKSLFASSSSESLQIIRIKSLPHHPSNICIVTSMNLMILEIDKFYFQTYGTHPSFLTHFSTINAREYINKAEGEMRKDISNREIKLASQKFQEQILINIFYISVEAEWIWFNLLEIQHNTMLYETRKYKMRKFDDVSCFRQNTGARTVVMVNFDGSEIIIFNKAISYYEVYGVKVTDEEGDLIGVNKLDQSYTKRIDFYSQLKLLGSGYCREICWHQFKNQFAVICGFDDKDKFVDYQVTKEKKGFFRGGKEGEIKVNFIGGQPVKFRVCIYQKYPDGYRIIQKSEHFESRNFKIFNLGSNFAYSVLQKGSTETLNFISEKNSTREIQGILNSPEQIYVSYCESFYILAFNKYFIIYKVQESGSMTYFRTVEQTILHGYFWEKFFFFLTEGELFFMQVFQLDILVIKMASNYSLSRKSEIIIEPILQDDLEPECLVMPPGQQQIAGVVNLNLVLLNEIGNATLISLQKFPYIVFCVEIASGILDQSFTIYEQSSKGIKFYMKKALASYGMITPDLMK